MALLSISPHNRAILEFFFAAVGKKLFRATTEADAEVMIIDFDHPGAQAEWEQRSDKRPGIVLSVREITANNAVWVPKPLTTQALAKAAEQVKALLPQTPSPEPALETPPPVAPRPTLGTATTRPFGVSGLDRKHRPNLLLSIPDDDEPPKPAPEPRRLTLPDPEPPAATIIKQEESPGGFLTFDEISTPEKNQEEAERRWKLLCGEREDLDPAHWQDSMLRYTPENYLLHNINDALRLSRQSGQTVQLKIDAHAQILLMPTTYLAYSSFDIASDEFAELCNTPLQPGRVHLHILSTSELAALESKIQDDTEHTHNLESLVWTVSLLTSHGRLGRDADANQRMVLKHWPNLTRLEQTPHVMRIAAVWHQRPGNLFEVAQWLDIPQRYVFAFYCASSTLGLLIPDHGKTQYKENPAPKKNRGLFSRLLKRLLGGGAK